MTRLRETLLRACWSRTQPKGWQRLSYKMKWNNPSVAKARTYYKFFRLITWFIPDNPKWYIYIHMSIEN